MKRRWCYRTGGWAPLTKTELWRWRQEEMKLVLEITPRAPSSVSVLRLQLAISINSQGIQSVKPSLLWYGEQQIKGKGGLWKQRGQLTTQTLRCQGDEEEPTGQAGRGTQGERGAKLTWGPAGEWRKFQGDGNDQQCQRLLRSLSYLCPRGRNRGLWEFPRLFSQLQPLGDTFT